MLRRYRPMQLARLRELRECGLGTVLSVLRSLGAEGGKGTNMAVFGQNLQVCQNVRTWLVSPMLTTADELPDIYYGHRGGFRALLELIRGSSIGVACESSFTANGASHVVFLLDFTFDPLVAGRAVSFAERNYSSEALRKERSTPESLRRVYGDGNSDFIQTLGATRTMSLDGLLVDVERRRCPRVLSTSRSSGPCRAMSSELSSRTRSLRRARRGR